MSYFKICPVCDSHLDPGEVCTDCKEKNTPVGADDTNGGGVEHVDHDVSTSHDNRN